VLHRLANTDLQAYLNHEDQIARYHKVLRQYFYPYMFRDQKFGAAELAALPRFTPAEPDGGKLPSALPGNGFSHADHQCHRDAILKTHPALIAR
jgi:hypothetical protein